MRVRSRTVRGDVVGASGVPHGERAAGERAATRRVEGTFRATLHAADAELVRAELDRLIDEVDRTAAELRRWRGKAQLEAYKNAVKAFLQAALEKMYRVESATGFDLRGTRVRSVIVQAIDAHLEALTDQILHGAESVLPLAARLDEIRGLLLDLYG